MVTVESKSAAWRGALAILLAAGLGAGCDRAETRSTGLRAVRAPAVAGQFYPGEPEKLQAAVRTYLDSARGYSGETPLALLAPHAGYSYSAQVAADAFRPLIGADLDVVVILGTNHTVPPFSGAAIYPGDYRTPLGTVSTDTAVVRDLLAESDLFSLNPEPHLREHSVEVLVPFVQTVLPRAKLVPIVVGTAEIDVCNRIGEVLARALQGRRALTAASSDLAHYPAYADAVASDREVLTAAAHLDPAAVKRAIAAQLAAGRPGLSTCACGEGPILAAISAARGLGARRGVVVSYANSGDALIGDVQRVVGYGALIWTGEDAAPDVRALELPEEGRASLTHTPEARRLMRNWAVGVVRQYLQTGTLPLIRTADPILNARQGAFVTWKKSGELRGCIGHLQPDRPLCRVVGMMALQAAFNDHRFPPIETDEFEELELEISVLSPVKPVNRPQDIVLGRDGVILSKAGRQAVFLPQVATEQNWNLPQTLENLCRKAGLPPDAWQSGCELSVFQAEVF